MNIEYGIARRIITPKIPVSLAGYFNVRMWDKVLDDIEVRAVVFKHGPDYAAILHFDLVTVPLYLCDQILDGIRQAGIHELTRENVTFSATHTHTGPEVRPQIAGFTPDYPPFAVKQAADAVCEAFRNLRQGELVYGQTADARFIFNRRYWMKNGRVMTNPGKLNPDILRPEGEIDPEIPMLGIRENGTSRPSPNRSSDSACSRCRESSPRSASAGTRIRALRPRLPLRACCPCTPLLSSSSSSFFRFSVVSSSRAFPAQGTPI